MKKFTKKIRKFWSNLSPKLRNHIVSAFNTFTTTFGIIFFTGITNSASFSFEFIVSLACASTATAVRAVSREILHALELTK